MICRSLVNENQRVETPSFSSVSQCPLLTRLRIIPAGKEEIFRKPISTIMEQAEMSLELKGNKLATGMG